MDELDRILRHTLADFRVSRGEKRVLKKLVNEMGLDRQQLSSLRHHAFDIARSEVISPNAGGVLDWLEDVIKILQEHPDEKSIKSEAHFSPGNKCGERIASLFVTARRAVDVCVFYGSAQSRRGMMVELFFRLRVHLFVRSRFGIRDQ